MVLCLLGLGPGDGEREGSCPDKGSSSHTDRFRGDFALTAEGLCILIVAELVTSSGGRSNKGTSMLTTVGGVSMNLGFCVRLSGWEAGALDNSHSQK